MDKMYSTNFKARFALHNILYNVLDSITVTCTSTQWMKH